MNRREVIFSSAALMLPRAVETQNERPVVNHAAVDDDLYWDAQWQIGQLEACQYSIGFHGASVDTREVLDILHRIPKPTIPSR